MRSCISKSTGISHNLISGYISPLFLVSNWKGSNFLIINNNQKKEVMYQKIKTTATANYSGAMETETILKNGANPKSLMSRENT